MILCDTDRETLLELINAHLAGYRVWAYGSRVDESGHAGSDLDLAIWPGEDELVSQERLAAFLEACEESRLPFIVDAHDASRLPVSFQLRIQKTHEVLV